MKVDPTSWEGALLWAVVALALVTIINLVLGRSSRRAQSHISGSKSDARRQRLRFLTQIAQVMIGVLGLMLFAHAIPALRPMGTALLASASVLTIVVGLAAQSTLGNLLAGVSIVLFRPFEAGDRIQLTGPNGVETGVVETVNLGNTIVSTFDNRRIVVPNGQLVNQTTINLSSVDSRIMAQININLAFGTDITKARSALREIIEAHPDTEKFESILVTALGAYFITLTAYAWCEDSFAARRLEFDTYERALVDLPARGIELPIPASAVTIVNEGDRS